VAATASIDGGTWVLENGVVAATINPERGADILSFVWLATGEDVLWRNQRSAAAPPRRGDTDMEATSYFDNYPGGIQELFPNAGAPTTVHGAPLPFHGEALRRPWSTEVSEYDGGIELVCQTVLTRYPFRMTKSFRLDDDSSVLRFSSTIQNLSNLDLPVHWGLHPAFNTDGVAGGGTVYGPFARVTAHPEKFGEHQAHSPGSTVAAIDVAAGVGGIELSPGSGGTADLAYATVDEGWFAITSPSSELLATMTWPSALFPELWIWQECHAPGGYPWFGTEHIVAIEPHTTSPFEPLAEEINRPEVMTIPGYGERHADFTLGVQPATGNQFPTSMGTDGLAVLSAVR